MITPISDATSPSNTHTGTTSTQKRKRRTFQYVSRYFIEAQQEAKSMIKVRSRKRRKLDTNEDRDVESPSEVSEEQQDRVGEVRASMKVVSKRTKHMKGKEVGDTETGTSETTKSHEQGKDSAKLRSASISTIKGRKPRSKNATDEELADKCKSERSNSWDASLAEQEAVPWQQVLAAPREEQQAVFQRIFYGLNVDALSSDSDLTDVPDDLGPDPFKTPPPSRKRGLRQYHTPSEGKKAEVVAVKESRVPLKSHSKPKSGLTKSPYFPHPHKPRPHFLSTLPFPPLHLERFGLMQERLCHDPFRLLLATIFLNKTPGQRAMPVFFKLMEKYPTPEKLAEAEQADVTAIIQQLGFQNQRARKCIAMSKKWVEAPPVEGRRWRKPGYPMKGDGKNIKADEVVGDEDERVAWEISHLPGLGPYSHDSWRMFCRDELRNLATAYNGEGAKEDFEPEWKRVLPADKELRAWMTWMWMKEGWIWNKETGERTKASEELMELARGKGNIVLESEASTLLVKSLDEEQPTPLKLPRKEKKDVRVEAPAGDFIPPTSAVAT